MATRSNSHGNTARAVRRFLREHGVKPNAANVERIGRELRRTESQNDQTQSIHREMQREYGIPSTVDAKGDVKKRAKAAVKRELKQRGSRP